MPMWALNKDASCSSLSVGRRLFRKSVQLLCTVFLNAYGDVCNALIVGERAALTHKYDVLVVRDELDAGPMCIW